MGLTSPFFFLSYGRAKSSTKNQPLIQQGGTMQHSKKLMVALAVIFLVWATPALADLDGVWEGYGNGSCYAPDGSLIHPWQTWNGEVADGTFEGYWQDDDGSSGGFTGGIICFYTPNPPTYTFAHCEGSWTWISPDGELFEMGDFNMEFNLGLDTCWGNWWPYTGAQGGTMWGWRIGN
jgi:hypothetical protein